MLPLNFVDGKGFHELLAYIEPEHTVPGRKMDHNKMKEDIKSNMEKGDYVAHNNRRNH